MIAEDQHIAALFELLRAAREGSDAFIPVVFWLNQDGDLAMALAPYDSDGGIPESVDEAAEVLARMEGPPLWVAVALDAYGRTSDTDPDGAPIGSLDQRFRDGDPFTVEQIMLLTASPDAPERVPVYRQVYRWTVVDGWEWDPVEEVLESVLPDGRLPDLLTSIVAP